MQTLYCITCELNQSAVDTWHACPKCGLNTLVRGDVGERVRSVKGFEPRDRRLPEKPGRRPRP